MHRLMDRVFPVQVRWKRLLVESLIFLGIYILWLFLRNPGSRSSIFIGNLAVLIPLVTPVLLILVPLPNIQFKPSNTWKFMGVALLFLSIGNGIRTFEAMNVNQLPSFSTADIVNFLAYPFLFYAVFIQPFENRYAPSQFRFLLDASITSGVVATLGWLILARPAIPADPVFLVPLVYPILDLILIMILFNLLLANRKARRTTLIWGFGLVAFLFSDFIYSTFAQTGSYQPGGAGGIGWVVGGLILSIGVVSDSNSSSHERIERNNSIDLGGRVQNILPVIMVLLLFGFVITDWQTSGAASILGLWMSLLLALALIARVGIRAGEAELHKYWQLFSSLTEPTFICDRRGKILLANPAMGRAIGKLTEQFPPNLSLAGICGNQTLPKDLFERAAYKPCTIEITLGVTDVPYLLTLSPIYSESRKILIAGTAHDLSRQKEQQAAIQKAYDELQTVHSKLEELNTQLEQKVEQRTSTLQEAYRQLEEQNKLLQQLDELKSDFVSMVSHELRTPLTSLNGGLELLLNRKGWHQEDKQPLSLMKNEVQRLTGFVENILNLSALEAGKLTVQNEPISISSMIQETCNKFIAVQMKNRVKLDIQNELPLVRADPGFLQSVLNHLIDNAMKYAPEGDVVVAAVLKHQKVRIQVSDSGPGIPKGKQRLLFKRFQRLDMKDSQTVYGFGLGLYLSKRMLQAMQSNLNYEESSSGGACFYFFLKAA